MIGSSQYRAPATWHVDLFVFHCRIFQPQCLGGLVAYFAPGQQDISKEEAYSYAVGIILCSLVPVAIFHHFILYIFQIGMKIRVACCSLLYKKASIVVKQSKQTMLRWHQLKGFRKWDHTNGQKIMHKSTNWRQKGVVWEYCSLLKHAQFNQLCNNFCNKSLAPSLT